MERTRPQPARSAPTGAHRLPVSRWTSAAAQGATRPTWARIVTALVPGARFAAMLFGDMDEFASDPEMTCLPPDKIEADLADFEIEHWSAEENDRPTALGDPHHFHLVEVVARKVR